MGTPTAIIGIDCATDNAKVGLCLATVSDGHCVVEVAGTCPKGRTALDVISDWLSTKDRALLAFDAPLGWPQPLGPHLVSHSAGMPLEADANALFRRATDRFVKDHLIQVRPRS